MNKPNDMILHSVTKVVVFIIFTFALNLFFSGHHQPGGGFIGGLVFASALVLLFLAFDLKSVSRNLPVDFKTLAAVGVLIAVTTGIGGMFFNVPFLTHSFGYINLPLFGETELATAVIFDTGVALAVIGTSLSIITTIGNDR